ncbi:hypothetical protein BDV59DRAFT_198399 [Aspergillus ambiguus]|uniref:uncharacterized protein n=1 Tax=Aspergillus ambiguus TaxID=176160 RepID=UPI003CCE4F4B
MKLPLFALLGYLVILVSSFGTYGAFERALFWYAYELDAAVNGKPEYIGSRCPEALGLGKRTSRCNFQQFLEFIDRSGDEGHRPTPITRDISGLTVDELGRELQNHGYTGKYMLHNVINGIPEQSGQIPNLMKNVAESLQALQGKVDNMEDGEKKTQLQERLIPNCLDSFNRVKYLRQLSWSDNFIEWLKNERGVNAELRKVMWPGSDTESRMFINPGRTQKANPGTDLLTLRWEYAEQDGIHTPITEALDEGANKLGCRTR